MKTNRFLTGLICLLFFGTFVKESFSALSASVVFEFRTAGDVTNGGCFDSTVAVPGTDYSQQDSAQVSVTDLVIDGSNAAIVTSATHNFVAADEGNCLRINSGTGFTTGWYTIIDTSSNAATLDRAAGTLSSTGGVAKMGGASFLHDAIFEAMTAGNTSWVKNDGTHTLTSSIDVLNDGTLTNVNRIIGYNTARNDSPTGADRPTIAAAANNFDFDDWWQFENLIFTTTAAAGLHQDTGITLRCKSTNSSGTAGRDAIRGDVYDSEAISTSGNGIRVQGKIVMGNYIHDSAVCIRLEGPNNAIILNILDTCSTRGLQLNGHDQHVIAYNTFYNGGNGIDGDGSVSYGNFIAGNIFDNWTTGILFDANHASNVGDRNNYTNNGTDYTNLTAGPNDTTLDPQFVDAANGNFEIGTNLKGLGAEAEYPGGLTDNFIDTGAAQREEASGGSVTQGYSY